MKGVHIATACILSGVLAICAAAPPAAAGALPEYPQSVASKIERVENGLGPAIRIKGGPTRSLQERMKDYGVPGLAVAVFDNYHIEWVKGYGVTDAAGGGSVTEETLFQAASISKPVAAAVALRYVQDGLLDLDENVNVKLRSWKVPENDFTKNEKVTVRRILSHTAGLTVSGFRGYAEGEPVPNILQVLDGLPPANSDSIRVDVTPGTIYRYSGGGYTVLQLLIEDVTGRPLGTITSELVFEPLGMANSTFEKPVPEALLTKTSPGHRRDGSSFRGHWFLDHGSTCCGLWTTPEDLARFGIGIQKSLAGEPNSILSADIAHLMITPQPPGRAGLGMSLEQQNGNVYFSHSGGNPGFSCLLVASAEGGRGAAVMTNSDAGGLLCREIVQSVADAYDWPGYAVLEFESIEDLADSMRTARAANAADPNVSEGALNVIGYQMLQSYGAEYAIPILTLNVEWNPRSANVYDSLAEAYLTGGDRERAIELYTKALETLERYPDENKRNERLRESIPKRLEELKSGQ